MMDKLSFTLGNIAAWFCRTSDGRGRCRGAVNKFFFRKKIKRFLWAELGVRLKTLTYVRQHTLDRAVFLANDKYYVKIFRDVSPKQICYFAFFMDYVRSRLSIFVPPVIASSQYRMYACERVAGRQLSSLTPDMVRPHIKKIQRQMFKFIDELQSIDVNEIPYDVRMALPLQHHHAAVPEEKPVCVLENYDMNYTNIFVDDKMNVCAVIDWDMLYVSRNSQHDRNSILYSLKLAVGE